MSTLAALAEQLGQRLSKRALTLTTAESCTGGMVAGSITNIAGSSAWFERGFVTYSDKSKSEMLGVPAELILSHGAVSLEVAHAMATGALQNSTADWAIAITGIAGPGGGSSDKPVGTVCFAWCRRGADAVSEKLHFAGDRKAVREQASAHVLGRLIAALDQA